MTDISFISMGMVTETYQTVGLCLANYVPAQLDYENADAALKSLVALAKGDGSIDGKNAEVRDGQARELFAGNYEVVAKLKQSASEFKLALDLAVITKSEVNALLRLAEITVQAESNEHQT